MNSPTDPASADAASTFDFSNLSGRAPGRLLRLARRWLPGVDHVVNEIVPYADAWHEHNRTALEESGPLWVALGDSLSLGIGATSIEQSWVLQADRMLSDRGLNYRVINLSISGARVSDVLDRELPAMRSLGLQPDLVTVLIGSNDVVRRDLRAALPSHYAALIAALPHGSLVAVADRPRGVLAEVAALVGASAATGAVRAVPARLGTRDRAEDHFHLNDHGYSLVAEDFVNAVVARPGHVGPFPSQLSEEPS